MPSTPTLGGRADVAPCSPAGSLEQRLTSRHLGKREAYKEDRASARRSSGTDEPTWFTACAGQPLAKLEGVRRSRDRESEAHSRRHLLMSFRLHGHEKASFSQSSIHGVALTARHSVLPGSCQHGYCQSRKQIKSWPSFSLLLRFCVGRFSRTPSACAPCGQALRTSTTA